MEITKAYSLAPSVNAIAASQQPYISREFLKQTFRQQGWFSPYLLTQPHSVTERPTVIAPIRAGQHIEAALYRLAALPDRRI